MSLLEVTRDASRAEEIARLRYLYALRALTAIGMTQRELAQALKASQPAISQRLKTLRATPALHPEFLVEVTAPVLRELAGAFGYSRLAVFGSVARGEARQDSDIDLIVESPAGTSSFDFIRFKTLIEEVLGRLVDLVDYGGLKNGIDDDVRRDAVLL